MAYETGLGVEDLLNQAETAVSQGQIDRARWLVGRALTLDQTSLKAWVMQAWLALDDWEERSAWERVLDLDPDHVEASAFFDAAGAAPVAEPPAAEIGARDADTGPSEAIRTSTIASRRRALRPRDAYMGTLLFVGHRLAFGAVILVAIIFLSYLGLEMARGTAPGPALAEATALTPAYVGRLARGDLGLTAAGSLTLRPVPISEVVPPVLIRSLGLLAVALVIATVLGVSLGIWAASRRHSNLSLLFLLVSIIGVSVPSFFAALLLQFAMIRWTSTFGHPLLPVGGFGWDTHLILPALVLAARPVAQIFRVTFVSVGDVLDQDYIRTAYSKGLRPRLIWTRHVARNAAIPILTTIGLSLSFALSSLPVVEYFFGWPGVGFTLLKAISRQDDDLTVVLVLSLGALFILVHLFLEASYRQINPRLRDNDSAAERRDRGHLLEIIREAGAEIQGVVTGLITAIPVRRWLNGHTDSAPSPVRALATRHDGELAVDTEQYAAERRRAWLRGTVGNLPFVVGLVLVVVLGVVFLFGPRLAPHSPYTTHGLEYVDGEFIVPPFAPDDVYPWGADALGRDVMSLILAGAQQTLMLATLVMLARVVVGFVLGAVAGWLSGSWADRAIVAIAEIVSAFPTLLLAMLLILALGIRQGIRPFVIALCFVGWGEIMQYVRAEVLEIRPKLFIESAVSIGLRVPRIIVRHVLPNLVPALISIAALEMGAVLMLLGELGFIGIFIGGGAFAELQIDAAPYHYSDVPEWGALLSNVRTYAPGYPWMAMYPALAFFVAILGFNLFGEGVRRMVESVGVAVGRLVNRYTVALTAVALLGFGWAQANTGAVAFYRQQAAVFDGQRAFTHVEALADPALDGRSLGSAGMEAAAEYIGAQFEALGLQAAGEEYTYLQTRKHGYELLDEVPQLVVEDGGPGLTYRRDYAEYPHGDRILGDVTGPVRFFATGELTSSGTWSRGTYKALGGYDFSDEILLLPSARELAYLWETPRQAALIIADDALDVQRRYTLSPLPPSLSFIGGQREEVEFPILWVSQATADRLLMDAGVSVADLRRMATELDQDEVLHLETGVTVTIDISGTVEEQAPVRHVVGHLPGQAASIQGAAVADTAKLDSETIMVLAQYDGPPTSPEGLFYPGANDNASGVAVMLEAVRTLQTSGYQPYRTFLFVAYSGEGLEGGRDVTVPEAKEFLKAKYGFATNLDVEAVVRLRGLGAGNGNGLVIAAGGNQRLANLFGSAADMMGIPMRRAREPVDIGIVFEDKSRQESAQEAPEVTLTWDGWEVISRRPVDSVDAVSADKLERAGRVLSLALMIMGREVQY